MGINPTKTPQEASSRASPPPAPGGLREVVPALVARCGLLLPQASPQALANACWGLALVGHADPDFLAAAAKKAAVCGGGLKGGPWAAGVALCVLFC